MQQQQQQVKEYYIGDDGLLVFTESYLVKRGFCCGNGCRHCPYDYANVLEPKRSEMMEKKNG